MAATKRRRDVWLGVGAGGAVVLAGAIAYVQLAEPAILDCSGSRTQVGDVVYEMPICQ